MTEIDYERLAEAIAVRLHALPAQTKIIWTAKQCADYIGVSERHFVDRLSKAFDFPAPIKLPTDRGRRGHARWYAVEVQDWVSKQKKH
jgi:predicted DNA-binding transcriptional regulator AlpA